MVFYIKFDEKEEPVQFTTALEAKEHLNAREDQASKVFLLKSDEAVADLEDEKFEEFASVEDAVASFDKAEAHPDAKDSEGADSDDDAADDDAEDDDSEEDDHSEEAAA